MIYLKGVLVTLITPHQVHRCLLLTLVCCSCANRANTAVEEAGFSGQRAYNHVVRLVELGPRPSGSAAAEKASHYIANQLKQLELEVRVDEFTAVTPRGERTMRNVIGISKGASDRIIALAGHYDTKLFESERFVGANDGGSSAGALLELARVVSKRQGRAYSCWFIFFDGEEAVREEWTRIDSLYGSRHLVAQLKADGQLSRIQALVLLDMIGDRNLNLRKDQISTPWLTRLVWQTAAELGHSAHFSAEWHSVEDDHLPFLEEKIPAVDLIDLDYAPWHTPEDTLDKISAASLEIVGRVVVAALPKIERYLDAER